MKRLLILLLIPAAVLSGAAEEAGSSLSVLDKFIFNIETDVSDGVGFLMEDPTGEVWMVSSSTVFQGAEVCAINNLKNDEIPFPEQIMVAANCDLIMFRTDQPAGLSCAESCGFEEEIWAFREDFEDINDGTIRRLNNEADSLKEELEELDEEKDRKKDKDRQKEEKERRDEIKERQTEISKEIKEYKEKRQQQKKRAKEMGRGFLLPGQAVALGPDRIEISALINRDGCGGPVLNRDYEVVGVSSHLIENESLPGWVTEGTRFEDVRRFALKLDAVEWMPFETKQYRKEGDFVHDNIMSLIGFARISDLIGDKGYFVKIELPIENRDIQRWIEEHNKLAEKYLEALSGYYRSQREVDREVKKLDRGVDQDFDRLIRLVRELEQEAGKGHRVSIPYYKDQLAGLEELFRNVRIRMQQIMDNS